VNTHTRSVKEVYKCFFIEMQKKRKKATTRADAWTMH